MKGLLAGIAMGVLVLATPAWGNGGRWTGELKVKEKVVFRNGFSAPSVSNTYGDPMATMDCNFTDLGLGGDGFGPFPFGVADTKPYKFVVFRPLSAEMEPLLAVLNARIEELTGVPVVTFSFGDSTRNYWSEYVQVRGTMRFAKRDWTKAKVTIIVKYIATVAGQETFDPQAVLTQKFKFTGEMPPF